jgi:hypothetical protein
MPLGTQAQMVLEARAVLKKVTTAAVGESWGECALEPGGVCALGYAALRLGATQGVDYPISDSGMY